MKRKILLFTALLATTISLASCGKKTYTVVFDSDGGSSVKTQKVTKGTKATKPTNPKCKLVISDFLNKKRNIYEKNMWIL